MPDKLTWRVRDLGGITTVQVSRDDGESYRTLASYSGFDNVVGLASALNSYLAKRAYVGAG